MAILGEMVCLLEKKKPRPLSADELESFDDAKALMRMMRKVGVTGEQAVKIHCRYQKLRVERVLAGEDLPDGFDLAIRFKRGYGEASDPIVAADKNADYWRDCRPEVGADALSTAAKSPRASLGSLRELTSALDFAMFPLEALSEPGPTEDFRKLSPYADLYVIAPIHMYDLATHVKSTAPVQMFGPKYDQALMALSMSIPLWRAITKDMAEMQEKLRRHGERLNDHAARITNAEQAIASMQQQLVRMENEVARAREATTERERGSMFADDPLAFAVPTGADIRGDGVAILGPCWGTDIEDAIVKKLGLSPDKAQRKLFSHGVWAKWPGY